MFHLLKLKQKTRYKAFVTLSFSKLKSHDGQKGFVKLGYLRNKL